MPKSFNASYGDATYDVKVKQYFSQNILAQTLNQQKYTSNSYKIKIVGIDPSKDISMHEVYGLDPAKAQKGMPPEKAGQLVLTPVVQLFS